MAAAGDRKPTCSQTGLAVPECSCGSCLEQMLREFRPALLAEEIKVVRRGGKPGDPPQHRQAA